MEGKGRGGGGDREGPRRRGCGGTGVQGAGFGGRKSVPSPMPARAHTHKRIQTHARIKSHKRTHKRARAHTHTDAHARTHAHTRTPSSHAHDDLIAHQRHVLDRPCATAAREGGAGGTGGEEMRRTESPRPHTDRHTYTHIHRRTQSPRAPPSESLDAQRLGSGGALERGREEG